MGSTRSTSIVVEMDNVAFATEAGAIEALRQILDHAAQASSASVRELIVAHPTNGDQSDPSFTQAVRASLGDAPGIRIFTLGVPDGRYYELKNAGAMAAAGDIVVFVDSDVTPAEGWLDRLVEPFRDPETMAAYGHTSMRPDSFLAKVLALCWFFPPPGSPLSEMRGEFFANNLAVRASWFRHNPFPSDEGFKNAHVQLRRRMRERGDKIVLVDARVEHDLWIDDLRGLLWRAAVDGRDGDRKAQLRHGSSQWRRAAIAAGRWVRMSGRTISRSTRYASAVGLSRVEVPVAIVIGLLFWTLTTATQLGAALGLVRHRREEVPARASD
jgi:hypothetical protein